MRALLPQHLSTGTEKPPCTQPDARALFLELVQPVLLACAKQAAAEPPRNAAEAPDEEGSAREAVLDVLRQCIASGEAVMSDARLHKALCFFEWAHLLTVRLAVAQGPGAGDWSPSSRPSLPVLCVMCHAAASE